MNKQEFLEEVGRLAERLFPAPEKETGKEYWARMLKEGLPPHVTAPRDVIEAWVRGEQVWIDDVPMGESLVCPGFSDFDTHYSLTDPSLPKPKKYRPWTWADRGLVPDELFDQFGNRRRLIRIEREGADFRCLKHEVGHSDHLRWDVLFEAWTQADGSPCGAEVEA